MFFQSFLMDVVLGEPFFVRFFFWGVVLSTTALHINVRRSGRATWFLSWAWGYKFSTVSEALKRWWARHERVSRDSSGDVYIWWCVMVNNQLLGDFTCLRKDISDD